jgi:hypothetical protein
VCKTWSAWGCGEWSRRVDLGWAGSRRRCVCRRQHYRCHGVVARRRDAWGCGWVKWVGHGVDGIIVAQVGLWGVLGEGGLGLDWAVTWARRAIDGVVVVTQVRLWGVVEEGETGLGRAGPPARLSSFPSCGGISVVFVGRGGAVPQAYRAIASRRCVDVAVAVQVWCCRCVRRGWGWAGQHALPSRHDSGVADIAHRS